MASCLRTEASQASSQNCSHEPWWPWSREECTPVSCLPPLSFSSHQLSWWCSWIIKYMIRAICWFCLGTIGQKWWRNERRRWRSTLSFIYIDLFVWKTILWPKFSEDIGCFFDSNLSMMLNTKSHFLKLKDLDTKSQSFHTFLLHHCLTLFANPTVFSSCQSSTACTQAFFSFIIFARYFPRKYW